MVGVEFFRVVFCVNMDGKSVDLTFGDETSFQDYEFDTYAEYNDSGDNNVTTNYVSSINVEEYAFQELDLDAKYRSIQAINSSSYSAYSTSSLNSMAPPSLSKGSSLANKSQSLNKAPLPIVVNKTNGAINVPEMPFHVAFTQFETKCDIDTVVSFIDHELKIVLEISHEFYHERCRVSYSLCFIFRVTYFPRLLSVGLCLSLWPNPMQI